MKKQLSRKIAFLLVAVMLLSSSAMAAETNLRRSSQYIKSYTADIITQGQGEMAICFYVSGKTTMDQVGALSIVLQHSTNGSSWSTVTTYSHNNYSNMLITNRITCNSSVSYSGVPGKYYRAYVTVWAGKNGDGESRRIWTSTVRA